MMRHFFEKSDISALCHIWQRAFLVLIFSTVTTIFGSPAVGLFVGTNGNNHHITVVGTSVGGFKSGIIECEYECGDADCRYPFIPKCWNNQTPFQK